MKINNLWLIFLLSLSSVGCQKIAIGVKSPHVYYSNDTAISSGDEKKDERLSTCSDGWKEKSSDKKTGTFDTDECGDGNVGSAHYYTPAKPHLSLETKTTYFWDTRFGFSVNTSNSSRVETKILAFPSDNTTSIARFNFAEIGIPFYYVWGDKELGKNDMAFRFGMGPQIVYFFPFEITSEGKTETFSGTKGGMAFMLGFYYKQFLFEYNSATTNIKFDKIKDSNGEQGDLNVRLNSGSFAYQYFF